MHQQRDRKNNRLGGTEKHRKTCKSEGQSNFDEHVLGVKRVSLIVRVQG